MTVVLNSIGRGIFDPVPAGFKNRPVNYNVPFDDQFPIEMRADAIIVFDGGADVSPSMYGEENTDSHTSPRRDIEEARLWTWGRENNIPMFGLCRGHQFMAVMAGGSLYQDLGRWHPSGAHRGEHGILFTDDAREYGFYEVQVTTTLHPGRPDVVNSYHHQAVKRIPADALLMATSVGREGKEGAVEALLYPYGVSVQWHPEYHGHNEWLIYVRDVFIRGEGYRGYHRKNNDRG